MKSKIFMPNLFMPHLGEWQYLPRPDYVKHETEKALLIEDNKGKFWIPKTLITAISHNYFSYVSDFDIKYIK